MISQVAPEAYRLRHGNRPPRKKEVGLEIEQELATLREWGEVQKNFIDYVFMHPASGGSSWRKKIEDGIRQCTHGRARIWWEPLPKECMLESGHLIEIRHQQIRYGILKLTSGYLVSHLAPNIHQALGHLCALVINLAEHQTLVDLLLKPLQPSAGYESLTPREKEVLECMALGDSEHAIAERLNIALTTVRTHRHRVYSCLDVHNPQDAILRSFALRLLNWLELSET